MDIVLETKDLTMAFGGHVALDSVNLKIEKGTFKSIIGPNGAGKTTLFNLISGQLKPTRGQVIFMETDVTHLSPHTRTKMGIGRSFQNTNVFPNLTVLENVRLAVQSQAGILYNFVSHYKKFRAVEEKAYKLLEDVTLARKAEEDAGSLNHGEQRKLEIAMLLALETELLLLDEPTAGMSLEEVPTLLEVIREIKEKRNRTVLLIEHKMDMVLDLSDNLAVLHNGKLLAEGLPEEIMNNEQVQSAYLGGLDNGAAS
ncbi:MAG: ABC transporter ATP-binding protein [Firmicutes bacterium HGW-Firmicutes-14]|nr:MAG: ABC transporter ATP-binding protein [Firmicutes bacterium HGW-Firmicutes-14]